MNTIQEIKDIANNMSIQPLMSNIAHVIHCYENNTLDEHDLYNLCRDAVFLANDIEAIQIELKAYNKV